MASVQIAPVAIRANVAAGTVYRYFPSKADLISELIADVSRDELAAIRRAADAAPGPSSALAAAVTTVAVHVLSQRKLAWGILAEPVDVDVTASRLASRREISGEIAACGADVPPARLGERVVLYQRLFCGTCRYCLGGRQDLCRNSRVLGEQGGGGYAEFACVPARNAMTIPDGLDMTAAALAVCPVGTSVRAALGVAQVEPGQTVLITGAGGGLGKTRWVLAYR